jgi:formiminotetrahydrofolate cyclodeaminase
VVKDGNPNAITDGGVGGLLGHAAMEGAILNVRVNTSRISDREYNQGMENDLKLLKEKGEALKEQILAVVMEKMGIS